MCAFRVTISRRHRQGLERQLHTAQQLGKWPDVTCLLAILAVTGGQNCDHVALTLRVTLKTVHQWVRRWLVDGPTGVKRKKPTGRPAKRTKTQPQARAKLIEEGPGQAGFASACWRSPLLQQLISERFGVFYNVFYLAQLLKPLGLSSPKAAVVSDHLNEAKRQEWCRTTWPPMLTVAQAKNAVRLFGEEASFPQSGTRAYTWARRGHQPMVKTSGNRKGDNVFGLIDDFTGRFWYHGPEGRLNSAAYLAFLTRVVAQTTQPLRLIQEGARYHTSAARQCFFARDTERLTVFQVPSYSPDDNPSEKLWKNVQKEGTHRHYFPTFEALTDKVEPALLKCANTPAEILALCRLPTE
jgi:transposase